VSVFISAFRFTGVPLICAFTMVLTADAIIGASVSAATIEPAINAEKRILSFIAHEAQRLL
jgi:hypothetical protein